MGTGTGTPAGDAAREAMDSEHAAERTALDSERAARDREHAVLGSERVARSGEIVALNREIAALKNEIAALRRAAEAKDLLASASADFDSSLDPLQTMRTIARAAVPRLADVCVIDLIREDGAIGDSIVAAVEEHITRRLENLRGREPLSIAGAHPVARALRSNKPVWVHDLTDPAALDAAAQSEEHLQFMRDAGYRSAVVIKLTARGRLLGALSFLRTHGGHDFDAEYLPLMQDVANRAATALDNANLYAELARVARTLQRSLLPDALPRVGGVELASAYRPAGEGSDVGGDFYDVFQAPSGCWLVVGDVCGKGTDAAAVTALVRHSVRALALQRDSPAEVLRGVNQAMLSHTLAGRFATAILVRLDLARGQTGNSAGQPVRATIASAGHPPPIVLDPIGGASSLAVSGTLLGVVAKLRIHDVELALGPGAALILYTDGLTEAGAPRHEIAPEELCRHLVGDLHATPSALVRRLEELATERSDGRLRDDIAIIAARVVG